MSEYNDFARYQDVFGQLRLLKSYTSFLLCFEVKESTSKEAVVDALQAASLKIASAFPWLTGKVVHEGTGPGDSGLFKVEHCAQWEAPNTILRVRDCYDLCPSYAQIVEEKGPIKYFDASVLSPTIAFPQSYEESEDEPACVLALQANFIKGGVIFDIAAQHNIMSGGAIMQFLKLFAKIMSGRELTPREIEQGNLDRRNMIQLLQENEVPINMDRYRRPSLLGVRLPAVPAPNGRWCTYRFATQKTAALKALASDSSKFVDGISFVSSNDTLTAFFWKRLAAIRLRRIGDPAAVSKFVRAVDVRSTMGIPDEYMGHMVYNTFSVLKMGEVDDMPFPTLTSIMRKNLQADVTQVAVRSFVTLLAQTPDKTTIMYGGEMDGDRDVACTSLAQHDIYNTAFGIMGKPSLFRRANFIPRTTTAIMFPKTLQGDHELLICLSEADHKSLKEDKEWIEYAELIDKD